ncbi:MAG: TetR/AcrR family transcriptional regulator [Spirochaetales bacterium]|uniref:TetR/AcrR family transcriptional regulator n=1 Tax=Candidatus Thalassospirochaeta sargassi TaxID=3119039 RepID=A0AAJ1IF28_9SPIO|nr:TetR/AcrR family transcriptional regulator [Spirochaetales bacterium]
MNTRHFSLDFMNIVHYDACMPKVIPQLDEQIIKKAEVLFIRDGFDGVSMRKLAAEVNIAVGTLYNYYPNKTVLFYSIMEKSWKRTFEDIKTLVETASKEGRPHRREAIELIYDGIKARGAFTNKTFELESSVKHAHKLKTHDPGWQRKLIILLAETLSPLGAGFAGADRERIIKMMIASIRYFIQTSDSDSRDADIDFLLNIVEECN